MLCSRTRDMLCKKLHLTAVSHITLQASSGQQLVACGHVGLHAFLERKSCRGFSRGSASQLEDPSHISCHHVGTF